MPQFLPGDDNNNASPMKYVAKPSKACRQVLLIEDDLDDVYLIKDMLEQCKHCSYSYAHCDTVKGGVEAIEKSPPDVILLDLGLKDSRGLETLETLVAQHADTPIIVLTGADDHELGKRAIKLGAEDYLPKRIINTEILTRSIEYSIERHRLIAELRAQAQQDPLTGLPNRAMIYDKLDFMIAQSERSERPFALVMLDMDKFKQINDTKGHRYGDLLLKAFAERIKSIMRRSDYVARYGGDEFFMIVSNYHDRKELKSLMEQKRETLSEPYVFDFDGEQVTQPMVVSVGVMEWRPGCCAADMLEHADQAMYQSKREQVGAVTFV